MQLQPAIGLIIHQLLHTSELRNHCFLPRQKHNCFCIYSAFEQVFHHAPFLLEKAVQNSIFSHHRHTSLNLLGINVEGCHLLRISWDSVSMFFQVIKQNSDILSSTELTEC